MTASAVHAQEDEESGAEEICGLHDSRLAGATGIVAAQDGEGWWIVPGGVNQGDTLAIVRVGADCNVRESEGFWIQHTPRDPQGLAFDTDGFLWVGDTGQALERPSIAINQVMPGDEANAAIYRFVFPDGPEAVEAFVVQPDEDYPIFFTSADGETTVYRSTEEKQTEDTPMAAVGTIELSEGGSVTGAALNADATRVVLRTANAAYEWAVEDEDVVGALTGDEPVVTPLADEGEPQGIAYDADGNFLTLSQVDGDGTYATINRYRPAAPEAEAPADSNDESAADEEDDDGFIDFVLGLGFDNIIRILAGIAVVGFLVMLGGILVIRKSRRERAEAEDDETEDDDAETPILGGAVDDPAADDPVDIGLESGQPDPEVGQIAQGGSVYGAAPAEPAGNVYGAKRVEPKGNVYGGARPEPTGGVYGSTPEPQPEPTVADAEPQYGAFEGAGQGSIYNDAGAFTLEPPSAAASGGAYGTPRQQGGAVYGGEEPSGPAYGTPREQRGGVYGGQSSNVEATGTVYGAGGRPSEPDEDHWAPPEGGTRRR